MMRSVTAIVLLALSATPAFAISNGVIDTTHRNVGALLFEVEPGLRVPICTGTLIAPTVFLTAAHCSSDLTPVIDLVSVTFDVNAINPAAFVPATAAYVDPNSALHLGQIDLGIIILSRSVTEWDGVAVDPAELPPAGLLDQLAAKGGLRGAVVR